MSGVQNTAICPTCGEEYWYDFDCRTAEYTKISNCKCDRRMLDAEEFLKSKGLLEEFEEFHRQREEELRGDRPKDGLWE